MPKRKVKNMDREQQKAMFWRLAHPLPVTKKRVINKMKQRSKRARTMDRRITAKNVYTLRDKKGKTKWMKHPNQYDLEHIDTAIAKEQYKARISKKQLKEKKIRLKKIHKTLEKKKQQIRKIQKPEIKQKIETEVKQQEQEEQKIKLDIRDVEVGHRKTKRSIHEKEEEKREVMYIMKTTENNNYVECKNLLDKAKSKGLAYDNIDWDELQGSDLTYNDRVRRLDKQIGHTYTQDELEHLEEKYQMRYEDYLESQRRGW